MIRLFVAIPLPETQRERLRQLCHDVRLEVRPRSALPSTVGDAAQFEQVLLNLVVNARDATQEGGVITVETSAERMDEPFLVEGSDTPLPAGEYVRLTVRDTGSGIPLEARRRIFEPFFSTKEGRGGSGFGLSTVQRIAQTHGGGIRVETEVGKGTAFHVYLPAYAASVPLEVQAATLSEPRGGYRVLVVEDDDGVRALLQRLLEREGHSVVAVAAAPEAIKAFDGARPAFDVVLVDVVLSERSGPDLVKALRRRAPELPVVYVTGYGAEAAQARGVEPSDLILSKPFSARALRDALGRALMDADRGGGAGRDHATGA